MFGAGTLQEVGSLASALGQRALVVGGSSTTRLAPLFDQLHAQGITTTIFTVDHEPTVALVLAGTQQAQNANSDLVIGMGGGSVIDTGKAIAALLTNPGDPLDYLEVVGRGQPLTIPAAPYIALPTTAGTGAEVTRNAVLSVPERRVKVSMRSPLILPRLALIDPELTLDLPPTITASTGLDALTQCVEPYVSPAATPLTDGFCREGIARAARSLRQAYHHGHDLSARTDMAIASLCGGLALANAKLGAVHGFAAPLGGMFPLAHGVVCACLLPFVMAANVQALQARAPDSPALARYDQIAQIVTGQSTARAADGVTWVQQLGSELGLPSLSASGITAADIPTVVAQARRASSMQGNPITLTEAELTDILQHAIQ